MSEGAATERIDRALRDALAHGELEARGLLTGWFLFGEYVGEDGDPYWLALHDGEYLLSKHVGYAVAAGEKALEALRHSFREADEDDD